MLAYMIEQEQREGGRGRETSRKVWKMRKEEWQERWRGTQPDGEDHMTEAEGT